MKCILGTMGTQLEKKLRVRSFAILDNKCVVALLGVNQRSLIAMGNLKQRQLI